MNRERLKLTLMQAEGFSQPYFDVSQWSGGYGHKLLDSWPIKERGAAETAVISIELALDWLNEDITIAVADTLRLVHCFDAMDEPRQEALVEMAFNLGYSRLSGFKRMLAAIMEFDWERAAFEAKCSKWYRQVGKRGERIVATLRGEVIA